MSTEKQAAPIEADIEGFDPSEMWTAEEREEYMNEMEEAPILMGSYTEEDRKNNTNFQALQSIIDDNRTDEEMVEDYQHEGKKSFALGKCMYSKAYSQFKKAAFYAERLPKTPENLHLLATLYGNCSLIQMKKENHRTCITDCDKALAIEPRYKKVLYRKAKSLAGLNDYKKAVDLCNLILEDEPDNIYTLKLKTDCEEKIQKDEKRSAEIARSEQRKEEERLLALKTMKERGYKLGPSLYEYPERFNARICVKNDELVFPVLILYPESSTSDYVREMSESDTFADIFYMLYPSKDNTNQPLDWDENKEYTSSTVEVWIQEMMVLPFPENASYDVESLRKHYSQQRWIRVNQNYTLGDVLRYEKYVIPGIPVIHIYAKNACRRDFFAAQKNELLQLVNQETVRPIQRCQHCGQFEKDTEEYKKCSRCKMTYYCSKECQIADWKIHKHKCGKKKE